MGKNKKRKRHALFHAAAVSEHRPTTTATTNEDDSIISEQDLEITIRTLQTITEQSHLLQSKACKQLRRILHPLVVQQMQSYERIDYGVRVTQALHSQKWADATIALQAAYDFRQTPKQGTIQRWVKDCDQAGDYKMRLLSAILRLGGNINNNIHDAGHVLVNQVMTTNNNNNNNSHDELVLLQGWRIPGEDCQQEATLELESPVPFESKIIYREHAADRKPPNTFDLLLHTTTAPGTIRWNHPSAAALMVTKHDVPFLPGAFCLDNVLTKSECHQLRDAATKLGFRPDHPVSMNKPTGIDSCEWLVDASIHSVLFSRVQAHLPLTMANGCHVLHSINPRWRFFRYAQDCVYRPHLDGSWPESRITTNGDYECDESGNVKSFLTFLIYLNNDFSGGETRFYQCDQGIMTARGVIPKMGAVLVFPQANTASLIHEGSAVTEGSKLVVRTDVLYRVSSG